MERKWGFYHKNAFSSIFLTDTIGEIEKLLGAHDIFL